MNFVFTYEYDCLSALMQKLERIITYIIYRPSFYQSFVSLELFVSTHMSYTHTVLGILIYCDLIVFDHYFALRVDNLSIHIFLNLNFCEFKKSFNRGSCVWENVKNRI